MKEEVCCPPFDPLLWQDKELNWVNKKFIRGKVKTFFFMPTNFGKVIQDLQNKVDNAKAKIVDNICLSDHTSKWNMDILLAVDKEIPNADNLTLSGTFYSKVYDGPFKETGNWCKDYEREITSLGFKIKKWYMWYTTCPKCAKKYGHNYTVIMAEVEKL